MAYRQTTLYAPESIYEDTHGNYSFLLMLVGAGSELKNVRRQFLCGADWGRRIRCALSRLDNLTWPHNRS